MQASLRTTLLVSGSALLLAACAPDAIIPSRPYDAFLEQLEKTCRGQAIGPYTVDQLVRRSQSRHGNFFMDQTSRLYFARINAEDWTTQLSGFLDARPEDPGIACVIREYNATREWTTPSR
ncbi:MAG: hypothetical protein AMJ64_15165 [Betaproteobacteria bacterium SG8_39]|nr:MAG: hypothetical protein AMJ64_15165 [Betaproteobacteria bacterium SG8_39]